MSAEVIEYLKAARSIIAQQTTIPKERFAGRDKTGHLTVCLFQAFIDAALTQGPDAREEAKAVFRTANGIPELSADNNVDSLCDFNNAEGVGVPELLAGFDKALALATQQGAA